MIMDHNEWFDNQEINKTLGDENVVNESIIALMGCVYLV